MKFFLGTTNSDKIREIGSILSSTGCSFEVTDPIDPDETEDNFEGNALLKARSYAAYTGGTVISEDSGIVIPALGGLPGPHSARFSDCKIDTESWRIISHTPSNISREEMDLRNNARVIELLNNVKQPRRAAVFKVVLVVSTADGKILFRGLGESYGWIAETSSGNGGFGYDPIFIGQDTFGKTYADLDPMRKNLRSHRRRVLQEFKSWLGRVLKETEA